MTFSIVTPSYQQFEWLKLNSASVQDQRVELEHIIQDAGSGDELKSWARMCPRTKLYVEEDDGMFDAINRGWRKACGEIIAQLNCDEQYLPNALERVKSFFDANPDVDVLYAAALVMDSQGTPRAYWKAIPLTAIGVAAGGISNPTASIFFRRRLLDQGFYFDPRWRCVGDAEWSRSVLAANKRAVVVPFVTSVYAVTGKNLSTTRASEIEMLQWHRTSPGWVQLLKWPAKIGNAFQRRILEPRTRCIEEISYFVPGNTEMRKTFRNVVLNTRWPLDLYSTAPPEPHRNV